MVDETKQRGDDESDAQGKPEKPGDLDFKKANEALKKMVRENQEWLKEMAKR
jgi:hypothetical protein